MAFTIETFQSSDTEAVARLWNASLVVDKPWNEPFETISRQQAQQPNGFFVGRFDGRVVATCIAGYDGVRGWLYRVVVLPERRRDGFGRLLVEHAENYLRQLGCVKVNLQVIASNETGVRFWKSNDYYEQDHTSMAKVLLPAELPSAAASSTAVVETIAIGSGVRLTELQMSDKPYLCTILNETEIYARNTKLPYPYLEAHADQWLRESCLPRPSQLATDRAWGIRDSNECLIGAVGLHRVQPGHAAELGYWLSTTWWGRGVATRAVEHVCAFAFDQLGLIRIAAEVVSGNAASVRVLEKNGFQLEGVLRSARKYRITCSDVLVFAKVRR